MTLSGPFSPTSTPSHGPPATSTPLTLGTGLPKIAPPVGASPGHTVVLSIAKATEHSLPCSNINVPSPLSSQKRQRPRTRVPSPLHTFPRCPAASPADLNQSLHPCAPHPCATSSPHHHLSLLLISVDQRTHAHGSCSGGQRLTFDTSQSSPPTFHSIPRPPFPRARSPRTQPQVPAEFARWNL